MNILMLNRFDIYSIPGTVRMVELSQQFVEKGHQVTLCYYPNDERRKYLPLLRSTDPPGVNTVKLNSNKTRFMDNVRQVRQYAKSADIVHFQKCFPEIALVALWVAFLENKPVHYDWDDLELAFVPEWTQSKVIFNLVKKYEDCLPKMVDSGSYSTEYVKKLFIQRGMNESDLIHTPVGADINRFHPDNHGESIKKRFNNKKIVLYIGQLEEGSYADLFIKAVVQIIPRFQNLHFLIVGGGIRLPVLQNMVAEYGIENHLTFTNYVPHKEIPDYVAAAEIGVACFEDNELTRCKSPLKIAEYLASGKPIVASAVGDIPQMVGNAGSIVPPGNAEKLADGIIRLISNENDLYEMKKVARLQAEKYYNWSVIADRFLERYQMTINKYQSKSRS